MKMIISGKGYMEIVSLGLTQVLCNPGWPPIGCVTKGNPEPIFLPLLPGVGSQVYATVSGLKGTVTFMAVLLFSGHWKESIVLTNLFRDLRFSKNCCNVLLFLWAHTNTKQSKPARTKHVSSPRLGTFSLLCVLHYFWLKVEVWLIYIPVYISLTLHYIMNMKFSLLAVRCK